MFRKVNYLKISQRLSALTGKVGVAPGVSYRFMIRLFSPSAEQAITILRQHRLFLILSTGRTGTTWLADLLNQAPGACVMHEPVPGERYDHARAFTHPETARTYLLKFRLSEMALRCQLQNPLVYGEVNGNLRRHAAAFKELVPDISIIHLVRDGRKVVRSIFGRRSFTDRDDRNLIPPSMDLDPEIWTGMSRFEKICWMWAYENAYLRRYAAYTIRFEDIISDYTTFEAQIATPLGLELSKTTWQESVQHTKNETTEYKIGPWENWTPEQQEQFTRICDQEMQIYDYRIIETKKTKQTLPPVGVIPKSDN
jgi:hypothetical protein